ncbi:GNAT family N-acetyltransferase [Dermacoccaceae bacterium W4C1]
MTGTGHSMGPQPATLAYPDPPLSDARVRLRPWQENDLDCVREAATDPRIPFGTSVPAQFTPEAGAAFLRRQDERRRAHEGLSLAICPRESGQAVGLLYLAIRPQAAVAGLGYWLIPSARGSGLVQAAIQLAMPWVFEAWQLQRLEAWVVPDNIASQRVLQACGFSQEGRLRNFLNTPNGSQDVLVYATTAPPTIN